MSQHTLDHNINNINEGLFPQQVFLKLVLLLAQAWKSLEVSHPIALYDTDLSSPHTNTALPESLCCLL